MRHKFISAFLAFVLFLLVVGIVNFKPPVPAGVVSAAANARTTVETATTTVTAAPTPETTASTTTPGAPTSVTTATQEPTTTTTAAPPPKSDTTSAVAPATSTNSPAPASAVDPVAECFARPPATGDVLFRTKNPGLDWQAQRLGGGYVYDHTVNECQDSVTWLIATIPTGSGYCGQVALASDNPTYDETVTPAPPLKKVIAEGGACA